MTRRQKSVGSPERGSANLRVPDVLQTSRHLACTIVGRQHPVTSSDQTIPFLLLGGGEVLSDRPGPHGLEMRQCPRRHVLEDRQECCRRQSSPLKCVRSFPRDGGGGGLFDLHQTAEDERADRRLRRHFQIPISIGGKKFCVAVYRNLPKVPKVTLYGG